MATDGLEALERHIARLRELPGLGERAAPQIARALEHELRDGIARGVAPDGTPWPPTKDGRQALANAGKALSVSHVGAAVVAVVEGVEARHDRGHVRGGVRRQILPREMTPKIAAICDDEVTREFRRTMGGR